MRILESIAATLVVAALAIPAAAQVDWSGNNSPAHGGTVQGDAPVTFLYQIYDAGRTEADGRGAGLGARLFYKNAAEDLGPYTPADMSYVGQAGIGGHDDLFAVTLAPERFVGWQNLEYYTTAYDSLVDPVLEAPTQQDVNGAPPPFVFTFGEATIPNNVYVHFAVCLNGLGAAPVAVQVNAGPSYPVLRFSLVQVAPIQIPDLWEGDVFLPAGVSQILRYTYFANGVAESSPGNPMVERRLVMTPGNFLQTVSPADSWGGGPVGCHLDETLPADLLVHLSVCLAGQTYSDGVCVSGDALELGGFETNIPLQEWVPGSDLFEGDVVLPAGRRAVLHFKFQRNQCIDWENLFGGIHEVTNRVLYIGGATSPYFPPTAVWANNGPNFCPPPTSVTALSWSAAKALYR